MRKTEAFTGADQKVRVSLRNAWGVAGTVFVIPNASMRDGIAVGKGSQRLRRLGALP
jgi:hypothetical protein